MKRIRIATLLLLCAMTLLSCAPRLVPPEADLTLPYKECWPGTITALSSGSLTLAVKDHAPMTFTLVAGTEYLRLYADTGETVTIAQEDLYLGAWVEIDCESYHRSNRHTAFTVTLIEKTA